MVGDQVVDTILRYVEDNKIVTDEGFLYPRQLLDVFNATRSKVLSDFMLNPKIRISPVNYLKTVIDKADFVENQNYSYFFIPTAVNGSFEYVGSIDYATRYRANRTIQEYQNTLKDQIPVEVPEYYEQEQYLVFPDNNIESIMLNFIPINPIDVPTFNYYYDEYPIDEALVIVVCDTMFAGFKRLGETKPQTQ